MKQKLQTLFDRRNPRQTLLNIAYVIFLISLFLCFIKQLLLHLNEYESFGFSEFLINYQGGFVRRGLLGEILFFFTKQFNVNVEWTIKIICFLSFGFLCVFFTKSFLKKGYTLYILPLCFFLGGIVLGAFMIRKDCLLLCFFIFILLIHQNSKLNTIIKLLFINILAIFIILSHEIFVLFSLPILLLLFIHLFKGKGKLKSTILSIVAMLPSIIAFFLATLKHGDHQTAQTIWDSWQTLFYGHSSEVPYRNAIGAIGWDSIWTFKFHFSQNFLASDVGIWSVLVWVITFPIVYYLSTNILFVFKKKRTNLTDMHKTLLSSLLLFQFICLIPCFLVLSCDYIRLILYCIATSYALFLIVPIETIENLFPQKYIFTVNKLNACLCNILIPTKTTLVLLMLFIGISDSSFHFETTYYSSMLFQILYTLTKSVMILKHAILFIL